jgi:hypothetical protein
MEALVGLLEREEGECGPDGAENDDGEGEEEPPGVPVEGVELADVAEHDLWGSRENRVRIRTHSWNQNQKGSIGKHQRKTSRIVKRKSSHLGRQLGLADGPGAKGEGHLGNATLGDGSLEEELECDLEAGGVNWG